MGGVTLAKGLGVGLKASHVRGGIEVEKKKVRFARNKTEIKRERERENVHSCISRHVEIKKK